MKLFENGVGRPSNEIKRKRKIFIISAVVLCVALISVFTFVLTRVSSNKLKGAVLPMSLNCQYGMYYIDKEAYCFVTSNGKPVEGATVKSNHSTTSSIYVTGNKATVIHRSSLINITISSVKTEYDSNGNPIEYVVANLTATKSGYADAKTSIKIRKKDFDFSCPSTAYANESFNCNASLDGVFIQVLNQTGLASSSMLSTTSTNKTLSIKYTTDLFNGTVEKDNKGEYVNVQVKATKQYYSHRLKTIKVYKSRPVTTKTTTTKALSLSCPSSAKIDQEFKCTTNMDGVKITIGGAKALASSIKSSFTTSSSNKNIPIKYTNDLFNGKVIDKKYIVKDKDKKEYINATITAEKNGKKVSKKVKIYRKEVSITCPSEVAVNEEFKCTTNLDGVTIQGSYPKELAKGYSITEKTKEKKFKYTKEGTIVWIKATKDGYNYKQVKVKIGPPRYQVYYSISKVVKADSNGTKKITIKPYSIGLDVEKYKFIICNERAVCFNYKNYPNKYVESKILYPNDLNKNGTLTLTTSNKNLLGSSFYIRTMSILKNGESYWKIHKVYVDLETLKGSEYNKLEENESKVKIGDSAGVSYDFLMSSKNIKTINSIDVTYEVSSVMKIKDGENNRLINVNLQNAGSDVKYVDFAICDSKKDCKNLLKKPENQLDILTSMETASPGRGFELKASLDKDLLDESFYIMVITYDGNKKPLYRKVHKFNTANKTTNEIKTERGIKVGDRVSATIDSTYKNYKKY